jgi:octaprenyl-diphosphate synthase
VHDDVVDESLEEKLFPLTRFGKPRFRYWSELPFCKGLLLSLDNNDFRILQIMSDAVRKMSEGVIADGEVENLNLRRNLLYHYTW